MASRVIVMTINVVERRVLEIHVIEPICQLDHLLKHIEERPYNLETLQRCPS